MIMLFRKTINRGEEMNNEVFICEKRIASTEPTFIIAEISANHLLDFDRAVRIIQEAKNAGADAVKLQTYTADTLTIDINNKEFMASSGSPWENMNLYELYKSAYTPWEWQPKLMDIAKKEGLICFSSPFDLTAVDFLEKLEVPAYKIASFEINDVQLIRNVAKKNKPIIISTGIALLSEIEEAINICKEEGNENVILLKCTSAYPSPYEDINLSTIKTLEDTFGCIVGLSDHTLGDAVATAGVALGAKVIEKHLTLKRSDGGPDSTFSMEPKEFKKMVDNIRITEKALGKKIYQLSDKQMISRGRSRSLYIVNNIKAGEVFTEKNIRSIRPANGLHTRYYQEVIGKKARRDLIKGTPLRWEHLE